jgi:hypothetical protein
MMLSSENLIVRLSGSLQKSLSFECLERPINPKLFPELSAKVLEVKVAIFSNILQLGLRPILLLQQSQSLSSLYDRAMVRPKLNFSWKRVGN